MSDKELFDYRYQILIDEWKMIDANIGRFDGLVFIVRGWALTLATGGAAYAYSSKNALLCIMLLCPVLALWVFDALFKLLQRRIGQRYRAIEEYLSSSLFDEDVKARKFSNFISPQVSASLYKDRSYRDKIYALARAAFLHNVWLFYSLIIVLLIFSYFVLSTETGLKWLGLSQ